MSRKPSKRKYCRMMRRVELPNGFVRLYLECGWHFCLSQEHRMLRREAKQRLCPKCSDMRGHVKIVIGSAECTILAEMQPGEDRARALRFITKAKTAMRKKNYPLAEHLASQAMARLKIHRSSQERSR